MVSTNIGEKSINIPATTLVLFYKPVPSDIRHIQRRVRTARDWLIGEVKILIMRYSRDYRYYWSSVKKEHKMYSYVYRLKDRFEVKNVRIRKIEG